MLHRDFRLSSTKIATHSIESQDPEICVGANAEHPVERVLQRSTADVKDRTKLRNRDGSIIVIEQELPDIAHDLRVLHLAAGHPLRLLNRGAEVGDRFEDRVLHRPAGPRRVQHLRSSVDLLEDFAEEVPQRTLRGTALQNLAPKPGETVFLRQHGAQVFCECAMADDETEDSETGRRNQLKRLMPSAYCNRSFFDAPGVEAEGFPLGYRKAEPPTVRAYDTGLTQA